MVDETNKLEDQHTEELTLKDHDITEELNTTSSVSLEDPTVTNKTCCENDMSDLLVKHETDNKTERTNFISENGIVTEKDKLELSNNNNEPDNDDRITFGDVDYIDFLIEHLKPSCKDKSDVSSIENTPKTTKCDLRASMHNPMNEISTVKVNTSAMGKTTCDKSPTENFTTCDTSQIDTESFHIEKSTSVNAEEKRIEG